jgi:hypothetical protein
LDNEKQEKESGAQWVEKTLADFESLHPGLIEKLSVMATQNQVRLSMYPQPTSGGASSSTGEQV